MSRKIKKPRRGARIEGGGYEEKSKSGGNDV